MERKRRFEKSVAIVHQVVKGLAHMHGKGYAYRDIKPENILFTDKTHTQVKLVDFGAAADWRAPNYLCIGTPEYLLLN